MINVYSNEHQIAFKYLKNTEANLCNVLVMARDLNIRDILQLKDFRVDQ